MAHVLHYRTYPWTTATHSHHTQSLHTQSSHTVITHTHSHHAIFICWPMSVRTIMAHVLHYRTYPWTTATHSHHTHSHHAIFICWPPSVHTPRIWLMYCNTLRLDRTVFAIDRSPSMQRGMPNRQYSIRVSCCPERVWSEFGASLEWVWSELMFWARSAWDS